MVMVPIGAARLADIGTGSGPVRRFKAVNPAEWRNSGARVARQHYGGIGTGGESVAGPTPEGWAATYERARALDRPDPTERPLGTPVEQVLRRSGGYERPGAVANPYPERYEAPEEDPVVALLGPEFAVPDDLQKYRTVNRSGEYVRPDPKPKRRTKGRIRNVPPEQTLREPLGGPPAYAVVDLPTRSAKGKWRGSDGQPLSTRVDPSAPTDIAQYKDPDSGEWLPQGRKIESYRDEGFETRNLTLGQAAKEARLANRTPVMSADALEYAMSPEGGSRFVPVLEENEQGVAGWLRTTELERSGRGQARPRHQMVPVYATDSVAEDGQPLFRVGQKMPGNADAVSAEMRELIPGAGTTEANPLDLVQRNSKLTRITPVRLQSAIEQGFQVGAPDPQTGAMPFQRPDGSSGLLVPEQVLGKGGVSTGKISPRFIVVDEGKMPSGEITYGPGAFLEPTTRAWIEKQSDLNPDGVSYWSAMDDIIAAGGTEPAQVRGKEIVAQVMRQRGLAPSDLRSESWLPQGETSVSQLADLADAMRSVGNRPMSIEQPVITGLAPRGSNAIAGVQPRALRAEQRELNDLYASPWSPLPGGPLPNPVSSAVASMEPAGYYPDIAPGLRVPTADFADAPFWSMAAAATPAIERDTLRLTPRGVTTMQDSVVRRLFQAGEQWPGGRIQRRGGEADQLELSLGLPAAIEPVASTNTIPRAGWDGLTEDFSGEATKYGSGYGVIQRPEMAPVAGAMESFMPIAQQFTFGDSKQAALVVETAMRTASPGPDGRVGAEQVIDRIMEIANPPMATGRAAGYAEPAPAIPETVRRKITSLVRPSGQVETDTVNVYGQSPVAATRTPVGGELSPVPWKRAVAGPAPVAQAALPAGAVDAAAKGYDQAVGASMPAPRGQDWIPGLPSEDAAFRARVDPAFARKLAYWQRAGERARNEQVLSSYSAPQADMSKTPGERLRQVLAEESAYRSSARSGYAPQRRVEQLGLPGWSSVFSA